MLCKDQFVNKDIVP